MGYVIRMPQMGMTMDEGTVLEWNVAEGSAVEAGDVIAEIESEKTVTDLEAREDGTVDRLLVEAGTTVEPGAPIGILTGPGEDAAAYEDEFEMPEATGSISHADDAESPAPNREGPSAGDEGSGARATPGARRRAEETGVDLGDVEGTGPQGVITEDDVDDALSQPGERTQTVTNAAPLSATQQTIADRLARSTREGVHVTVRRRIEAEGVIATAEQAEGHDLPVGISDILIKAVAEVLGDRPKFNALFEDGELRQIAEINVAVAVDMERGLVTPVIPNVDGRSLESIAEERRSLTELARADEFTAKHLEGGTFTVSNLGMFGVDSFDPVIDPPQVAILGVGRIQAAGAMTLSLTFDHRVINGAEAAQFLDDLASRLEDVSRIREWFETDVAFEDGRREETREIRVRSKGGLSGAYAAAGVDVPFDEPIEMGGTGQAPTPVEHLLGALGSCLTLSVRTMAERDGVELGEVVCNVDGRSSEGPLEGATVEMTIESAASDEELDRVLTKAERACYVERALGDAVEVEIAWARR